ncbi:MAG: thiosulfate/3-mercaptopyruvate sulfurtransferase [Halieaceae bacterium]|jgi:thiosulfate/3-mercaptopyruvate sulfurtransferase
MLIEPELIEEYTDAVIFDCRFALGDAKAGSNDYSAGHIPGACYIDLNGDLSAPVAEHGGRHPLPAPQVFAGTLARFGVDQQTQTIAYDDSRCAFASRLWWMMRSLGYTPPLLVNGGYTGWLNGGGVPETAEPEPRPCLPPTVHAYEQRVDINGLRAALAAGALLIDSREAARYQGLEEPIDPVAGHIPGAINRPWQGVTDAHGLVRAETEQRDHWGDALDSKQLVVYCGSGVTACVNLFSLSLLGRDDAVLYAGSWSDWCSYLQQD